MSSLTFAAFIGILLFVLFVNSQNQDINEYYQPEFLQLFKIRPCTPVSAEIESCLHNVNIRQHVLSPGISIPIVSTIRYEKPLVFRPFHGECRLDLNWGKLNESGNTCKDIKFDIFGVRGMKVPHNFIIRQNKASTVKGWALVTWRIAMDQQNLAKGQYVNYDQNRAVRHIMEDILKVEKRGQHCGCQVQNGRIDLGTNHFPRFLKNVTCGPDDENKRHSDRRSQCTPIYYPVKVLTARTTPYLRKQDDHDYFKLPEELRRCWKYVTVDVASGCMCG